MHERPRSPYASPSRSPWRSRKCPRNKRLRMARRSIWTRAKPCVGLERPHFCTRLRGQSESWVAPAQQQTSCGARAAKNLSETGAEGRNYLLQLRLHHLLHLGLRTSLSKQKDKQHEDEKSDTERKTRLGGSDPTYSAFSRPKSSGVAPALAGTSRQRVLRGRVGQRREFVRQHV